MKSLFALMLILCLSPVGYAGDVLFIDLNNSDNEVNACQRGVKTANPSDTVRRVNFKGMSGDMLERVLSQLEAQGIKLDSIVISGHDNSGRFSGLNGDLSDDDLRDALHRHARLAGAIQSLVLWGCYAGTMEATTKYWMNNMSSSLKNTISSPGQSKLAAQQGNADQLAYVCNMRQAFSNASSAQEINDLFFSIQGVNKLNLSICYKDKICSGEYSRVGERQSNCVHSYDELMRRCGSFDPGRVQLNMFRAYLEAKDARHSDPNSKELRQFYNQLHLWIQCKEKLKAESGYEMPDPTQVIRLTLFDKVKKNFARIHASEISQYNEKLHELGMDQFALNDLPQMTRQQIVRSTLGAVAALKKMSRNQGTRSTDPEKVLLMASGFDLALHQLDYRCVDFSLVLEHSGEHSYCIADYGRLPEWPQN